PLAATGCVMRFSSLSPVTTGNHRRHFIHSAPEVKSIIKRRGQTSESQQAAFSARLPDGYRPRPGPTDINRSPRPDLPALHRPRVFCSLRPLGLPASVVLWSSAEGGVFCLGSKAPPQ